MKLAVNAVGYAPGGGLTYLINQARQLGTLASHWEIKYFVTPRCREPLEAVVGRTAVAVPFRASPSYASRLYWEQVTLPKLLREHAFDVLYAIGGFAVFRSPVPQLVLNANALHHTGRDILGTNGLWLRYRVERIVARRGAIRAERLVFPTEAFAQSMMAVGFPGPTAIIASGVSVDLPTPSANLADLLDCEKCVHGGYVLNVNNWYRHKNLPWLMQAWSDTAELRQRHLVIVGQTSSRSVARHIMNLANRPYGKECIHLRAVSRAELSTLYAHAELYISASLLESYGLTPFEAMSFSVPCVLSDIGPHREVAGDAAFFFKDRDVGGLVSAVQRADSDRARLIEQGRKLILTRSWHDNVGQLIDELKAAVNG